MITLKEITEQNVRECLSLSASDDRKDFVANSFVLAWTFRTSAEPYMIYNDNIVVGFLLLNMDSTGDGSRTICVLSRLMIDKNHQRRGYAKAAIHIAIDYIKNNTDAELFCLSYNPNNLAAKKLYESLNFITSGSADNGEIIMKLNLK